MKYKRPPGTNDVTPEQAPEWHYVESVFNEICRKHCFGEIRTPIFEDTDLFIRSVGEGTDIVSKEMYTFEDRGGRSMTLRAEGTAPAVRAYLENTMNKPDMERLVKLYYEGPIFRYDRPQAGRYRQHTQFGLEAIGSANPAVDAEIIQVATEFYHAIGISAATLKLNSVGCPVCAPEYVKRIKEYAADKLDELCEDCVRRYEENPLRIIDCKNKHCNAVMADAPKMTDTLCPECDEHFAQVKHCLDLLGIEYELDPYIVRGLDYYSRTAFEFVAEGIGAQSSIGGGGRYDGLVEQVGGKPTPAVGMGIGVERALLVRQELGLSSNDIPRNGCLVVTLGDAAWDAGLKLTSEIRAAGLRAEIDYRRRSMKAQMRFADKENFAVALILGDDELKRGIVALKPMDGEEQQEIALDKVVEHVAQQYA